MYKFCKCIIYVKVSRNMFCCHGVKWASELHYHENTNLHKFLEHFIITVIIMLQVQIKLQTNTHTHSEREMKEMLHKSILSLLDDQTDSRRGELPVLQFNKGQTQNERPPRLVLLPLCRWGLITCLFNAAAHVAVNESQNYSRYLVVHWNVLCSSFFNIFIFSSNSSVTKFNKMGEPSMIISRCSVKHLLSWYMDFICC